MTRIYLTLSILLIALEISLRLLGVQTWDVSEEQEDRGKMFQSDPKLGWGSKPGSFKFILEDKNKTSVSVNVNSDRSRRTSLEKSNSKLPMLAFVGDSFSYGWEVSDDETFLWKLQQDIPDMLVKNFAVPGFSGFQSLIRERQILFKYPQTKYLIYGYCDFHKYRNLAEWVYFRGMVKSSARRDISPEEILMPYAEIDGDGNFIEHAPVPYTYVPLGRYSAIIRSVEDAINKFQSDRRAKNMIAVELKIIEEMDKFAKQNNAQFVLVNLVSDFQDKKYLLPELEKRSIRNFDCDSGGREYEKYLREGVNHPDGKWHDKIAECIRTNLNL
jgi:hypothetical protein